MKLAQYTDRKGRQWKTLLPDAVPESQASRGVPFGPPSLASLGLPEELEVRLHNLLFERGFFKAEDLRGRENEIAHTLIRALKIDAQVIMGLYE